MPGPDPISGGISLVSLIMDQQAKNRAAEQAAANLQFQRNNADRQFRLSTAGRTDALGDKTRFDNILNQWITELSPTQQALAKAGEREQLQSLTHDAAQNRTIRDRAAERGRGAAQDYNTALAGYRYDQPHDEASTRDELTSLLSASARAAKNRSQGYATTNALRTGNLLPNPTRDEGPSLADIMLQARGSAANEFATRTAQHNSKYLPALQNFAQTMDAGGNAPLNFSNTTERLAGEQTSADKLIQSALESGGKNINAASALDSKALGQGPDIRGIAALYTALKGKDPAVAKGAVPTVNAGDDYSSGAFDDWFSGGNPI